MTICAIKCIVQNNFRLKDGAAPAITKLLVQPTDSINTKGNCSSPGKLVPDLGFRWEKTKTNGGILNERHDTRYFHVTYVTAGQSTQVCRAIRSPDSQ